MWKYFIFVRTGTATHRIARIFKNDWEAHDHVLREFPDALWVVPKRAWRVH